MPTLTWGNGSKMEFTPPLLLAGRGAAKEAVGLREAKKEEGGEEREDADSLLQPIARSQPAGQSEGREAGRLRGDCLRDQTSSAEKR